MGGQWGPVSGWFWVRSASVPMSEDAGSMFGFRKLIPGCECELERERGRDEKRC